MEIKLPITQLIEAKKNMTIEEIYQFESYIFAYLWGVSRESQRQNAVIKGMEFVKRLRRIKDEDEEVQSSQLIET